MGRIDDVVNISGHRLGTAEIESALVSHDAVAEAAVTPIPHDIKGQGLYCFVTLVEGVEPTDVTGLFYSSDQKIARKREMMRAWTDWCDDWCDRAIREDLALRDRDLMAAEIRRARYRRASKDDAAA